MIILHNPHSKESRDFVAQFSAGNTVIDWYGDPQARDAYLAEYPHPGKFPAIVDEATKMIVNGAVHPDELTAAIASAPVQVALSPSPYPLVLAGNGVDELVLHVRKPGAASIDVTVETDNNGMVTTDVVTVPLLNGEGDLRLVSDQPGAMITVTADTVVVKVKVI